VAAGGQHATNDGHNRLTYGRSQPHPLENILSDYILWLDKLGMSDLNQVGGKNASLGEMISNLSARSRIFSISPV
jgi:hypothetical protein